MGRSNTLGKFSESQKSLRYVFLFIFGILTLLPSATISSQIIYCPYCPANWVDTIAPHASCQPSVTAYLDALGGVHISPIYYDNYSTDNCPTIIISASQTQFSCADIGTKNVILYVRDPTGNHSQCTTKVTILDTIRPKALKCANDTTFTLGTNECSKNFAFAKPTVSDNCSSNISVTQTSGLASGASFPAGVTNISFTSSDPSNNTSSCSFKVTVLDPPPTVTCKTKYAPRLSNGGTSRLVVSPLDVTSAITDNCTPLSNLNLKIRRVGAGTGFPDSSSITFGCGDVGSVAVEVWAKDQANQSSSCSTTIYVNDSSSVCYVPPVPAIMGHIVTEEGRTISTRVGMTSPAMSALSTNVSSIGLYQFSNLVPGSNYIVTPARDSDWINGVTTFDVALISRHVLSSQVLTSPYKLIAADVNRDGSIDALDMLIARRVVLRQMDNFPNNRSWRFIPKSFQFPTDTDPLTVTYPESLTYSNLKDSILNADFIAIKIADINGTAVTLTNEGISTQVRSDKTFVLETTDTMLEAGKTYDIAIKTPLLNPEAFQFTLNFDKNALKIHSIDPVELYNFSSSNYAVFADRGKVTVSWNSSDSKAEPMNLFTVKLQATRSIRLSDAMHLTSDLTPAEAYSSAGEQMAVNLRFNGSNTDGNDFALFQNDPNPFNGSTRFSFRLPQESDAKLTVFDATGRIVKTQNGHFNKGDNVMTLDFHDTPSVSGVLFYRLDTPTNSATQRMMLLN